MGIGFYGLEMSKGAVSLLQHASNAVPLTRCLLTRKSGGSRGKCVPRCWRRPGWAVAAVVGRCPAGARGWLRALLYTQMCLEKPLDGASRGWAVMPGCLESRCRLLAAARGLLAAYLCPAIPNEEVCVGKEP